MKKLFIVGVALCFGFIVSTGVVNAKANTASPELGNTVGTSVLDESIPASDDMDSPTLAMKPPKKAPATKPADVKKEAVKAEPAKKAEPVKDTKKKKPADSTKKAEEPKKAEPKKVEEKKAEPAKGKKTK